MLKIILTFPLVILLSSCLLLDTPDRYVESSHADSATIEFEGIGKTQIRELEICQKDNSGIARLSKDGNIKVKANEPTNISLQIFDRGLACNVNIGLNFSANKKYVLTAGGVYEKRSKLKKFIIGAKGVCKIVLDDVIVQDKFEEVRGIPLKPGGTCKLLTYSKNNTIINADKWIKINKALNKK